MASDVRAAIIRRLWSDAFKVLSKMILNLKSINSHTIKHKCKVNQTTREPESLSSSILLRKASQENEWKGDWRSEWWTQTGMDMKEIPDHSYAYGWKWKQYRSSKELSLRDWTQANQVMRKFILVVRQGCTGIASHLTLWARHSLPLGWSIMSQMPLTSFTF